MSDEGGGTKSSSSQTASPPRWALPYYQDLYKRAQTASKAVPSTPYPGPFIAPVNPLQNESLGLQEQYARSLPANIGAPAYNLGQSMLRGDFLSPESNPYLSASIDAAARPVQRDFDARYQNLNSTATGQGAFDNIRRNFEVANLEEARARSIGDTAATFLNENLARERFLQLQAPGLVDAGLRLDQLPATLLGQIGDVRRQFGQEDVQAQQAAYQEQINAPFRGLSELASILSSVDVGGTTQFRGKNTQTVNPVSSGITGALGGSAIGGSVGGDTGAGIGALLGLILAGGFL